MVVPNGRKRKIHSVKETPVLLTCAEVRALFGAAN